MTPIRLKALQWWDNLTVLEKAKQIERYVEPRLRNFVARYPTGRIIEQIFQRNIG